MKVIAIIAALLVISSCSTSQSIKINLPEDEKNQILAIIYSNTKCRVKKVKQLDAETIEAETFYGSRSSGIQETLTLKKENGQWVLKDKAELLFCPG
jgi:hypothetical protein